MTFTSNQWIESFRRIGKNLLKEVPLVAGRERASVRMGRGAGGDQTFFIDEMAEDIVLAALEDIAQQGNSFTLISEECGLRRFGGDGDIHILLDPLDGSNNAKRGIPCYVTSIAVLAGDRLENLLAGYIIDLSSGKEYWAMRGDGAWCEGEKIRCRSAEEIEVVAFESSAPSRDIESLLPLLKSARKVRCLGSIALDLALMAAGAVDVLAFATPSRSFDYAAGVTILQEAGGVITDMAGRKIGPIKAGLDRTVPLLAASNSTLHGKAIDLLRYKGN